MQRLDTDSSRFGNSTDLQRIVTHDHEAKSRCFNQSAKLRRNGTARLSFPSRKICCQCFFEFAELLKLGFRFGERRLGYRNHTAAGFLPLAPQAHDAPNFIEAEPERLRFADEPHLLQRGVIIYAITARRSRRLRKESASLVKPNGVRGDPRELCQPPDEKFL